MMGGAGEGSVKKEETEGREIGGRSKMGKLEIMLGGASC